MMIVIAIDVWQLLIMLFAVLVQVDRQLVYLQFSEEAADRLECLNKRLL